MSKIKDIAPSNSAPSQGQRVAGNAAGAIVNYGDMINGIPAVQQEHLANIDDALDFAAHLIGQHPILYIDYMGLKLGVN